MSKLEEFIEGNAEIAMPQGRNEPELMVSADDLRELGKDYVLMEKELLLACYEWALDAQAEAKELAKINEPYPLRQQRYHAAWQECSQNVEKLKAMIQASE